MPERTRRPPRASDSSDAPGLSRKRVLLYGGIAAAVVLYALVIVVAAASIVSVDHYLISYYIVDYTFGFVRRGLGGAIVGNVAEPGFFEHALIMRWFLTTAYLASLGAVAYVLLRRVRTERRIMLALLIAVLPFGVPFAVSSGRPDLLGAVAMIVLALSLATVRTPRSAFVCCGAYGLFVGVLAFIHEGIPFEFALGAILAILVLAPTTTPHYQRLCAGLAMLPGLVAAVFIAAFSARDISAKTCALVPHRMFRNPFQSATADQLENNLFGENPALADYHDWVCGWYLRAYDYSIVEGIKEVMAIGPVGLTASFLLGLVVIAVTVGAVRFVSGVPVRTFVDEFRGQLILPVLGAALMLPIFLTGLDWTRWLLVIGFNVAIVYLLFARTRPEIDQPPSPKVVRWFVVGVIAFALIPTGLIPGGPVS